jgi:polyhydroxyalkanoate synthesis regulator phasin
MAEPADMIVPLLREMRAENLSEHEKTRAMIALLDKRLGSVTGEFEERIEALEQKLRDLETQK